MLFSGATFICIASAQTSPPERTFRVISAVGSFHGVKYDIKKTPSASTTVTITINQVLSEPYKRPAAGAELEFYREIPPPPEKPESKPIRVSLFTVKFPAGATESIIVLFPTSKDRKAPLRAQIFGCDPLHKAGMIQLINYSSTPAATGIGDVNITLEPGQTLMVPAGAANGRILVQTAIQKGGRWIPAFRGERRVAQSVRGFIFIFDYMDDPDYGPEIQPPPALTKIIFEPSPEAIAARIERKKAAKKAAAAILGPVK